MPLDEFINGIGQSLTGLQVVEARMQFKIGLVTAGEKTDFVVPGFDDPAGTVGPLREIRVRFGRTMKKTQ